MTSKVYCNSISMAFHCSKSTRCMKLPGTSVKDILGTPNLQSQLMKWVYS